jgi:hypothetical protein
MPRWAWIALLVLVAAYGWRQTAVLRARGANEIVAINRSGQPLEQLRFTVGGRRITLAKLEPGAQAKLAFLAEHDGTFDLTWRPRGGDQDRHWSGGRFTHGPIAMRHRFEFVRGDGIVWRTERRPEKASAKAAKAAKTSKSSAKASAKAPKRS